MVRSSSREVHGGLFKQLRLGGGGMKTQGHKRTQKRYTLKTYSVDGCHMAGPFTIEATWVGHAIEAAERRGLSVYDGNCLYPNGTRYSVLMCITEWYRCNIEVVRLIRKQRIADRRKVNS